MLALYWFTLRLMLLVAPSSDPIARHGELATAIAEEASRDPFVGGSPEETAALDVAVAFRESSLRKDAVGDGGHSRGAFQCYNGPPELLDDPVLAVRTAHRMMKESRRFDRAHPLAFYARGPRFRTPEAQRISDDRVNLARFLLRSARSAP